MDENVTWTLAADNTPASLNFGNVVLDGEATGFAAAETKETDHKYMIPVMGEEQTYTVQFKVIRTHHGVTDEYDHEVSIPSVDWAAGNSYAFVAKLEAKTLTRIPNSVRLSSQQRLINGKISTPLQQNFRLNLLNNHPDLSVREYTGKPKRCFTGWHDSHPRKISLGYKGLNVPLILTNSRRKELSRHN